MSWFDFAGNLVSAGVNAWSANENRESQERMAAQNIAMQREFAQQGIRWKVQDAQAAGLHPLAALGANTTSFSPVTVGSTDFSSVGQDLGRAISAMKTSDERSEAIAEKTTKLALEKGSLENDLLRSQIRRLNSTGTGPGMPTARAKKPDVIVGNTISENAKVKEDDIKQKAEDHPQTKTVRPFGYPLQSNPYFSDGQQFEDRYGESEVGSTAKFIVNSLADHAYTGYKWLNTPWDWGKDRPSMSSRQRRFKSRPWGE